MNSLLGEGKVNVRGEMADVVDGGTELGAVDGGAGVSVNAVEAGGVKVGVCRFVGVIDPARGGFDVSGGIDGDRVIFQVVKDVLIGPVAEQE